jgi:hypothetical protein
MAPYDARKEAKIQESSVSRKTMMTEFWDGKDVILVTLLRRDNN